MIFCNILLTLLTVRITPATHWVVLKLPLHFVLSLFSWKTQVKINSSLAKQNQPFNPSSICVYLAVECRNDIFPIFVVSLFPADDGWWNMGNITWRQFIRIVYAGLSTLSSLPPRHVFDFCLLNTTRASYSKKTDFCSFLFAFVMSVHHMQFVTKLNFLQPAWHPSDPFEKWSLAWCKFWKMFSGLHFKVIEYSSFDWY